MIEQAQLEICQRYQVPLVPTPAGSKLGAALSTKGRIPINGLRHPPNADNSGWYIWWGEEFSEADDFFDPLHAQHIYDDFPEIGRLLGLPPGYRFLIAGDYLDVWFNSSLLEG
jgi:hypothetical protein